ncbi:hypothetical protein F8M41_005691 [Gigaspora margarita]|uniref:Uncharacterized protein n=1 Tax=Gigaspora margarita TaxID=4874 RepID=A0A8H3X9P5_GIGMA|nr:hypothetical protein F8M41_005691 [Gigaspora margarita]
MAGYFDETIHEYWSLDGLAEWCAINTSCDKKRLFDIMKKAIQDVNNYSLISEAARIKAISMRAKLEENLRGIKEKEAIRLAQIKSDEIVRLAEIKSKNLQEHTVMVANYIKNIANDLTTVDRKRKGSTPNKDEELTPAEDFKRRACGYGSDFFLMNGLTHVVGRDGALITLCASYRYWDARSYLLDKLKERSDDDKRRQVLKIYYYLIDMLLENPYSFINKEGEKKKLTEIEYIKKVSYPILDIIFSNHYDILYLKWGEEIPRPTVNRNIDLRVLSTDNNVELSHSEFACKTTSVKVIKDRSKCIRTNKCI